MRDHFVIDTTTLGNSADDVVLCIGVTAFSAEGIGGSTEYVLDIHAQMKAGRTMETNLFRSYAAEMAENHTPLVAAKIVTPLTALAEMEQVINCADGPASIWMCDPIVSMERFVSLGKFAGVPKIFKGCVTRNIDTFIPPRANMKALITRGPREHSRLLAAQVLTAMRSLAKVQAYA